MPVKRRRAPGPDEIQAIGRSFVETDDNARMFGSKADVLKEKLKSLAAEFGDADEDGHIWVELTEPIESRTLNKDKVVESVVTGFKREKRVKRYIDQERAEEWLKKRRLWAKCTETFTVTEIAEDKIWLLVMEGKLTEEEVNSLYNNDESFALIRVTE